MLSDTKKGHEGHGFHPVPPFCEQDVYQFLYIWCVDGEMDCQKGRPHLHCHIYQSGLRNRTLRFKKEIMKPTRLKNNYR